MTDPPLHSQSSTQGVANQPLGQGTVGVISGNPDTTRPFPCNSPPGSDAAGQRCDPETAVVGRARAIQRADGTYHGHITILALAGNEIVPGVDTGPGDTVSGPLNAAQTQILDMVCTGSAGAICLQAVVANSTTTTTGSMNHFETANAALGGTPPVPGAFPLPAALGVGAASSDGCVGTSVQIDPVSGQCSLNGAASTTCQTGYGHSRVANVAAGPTVLAKLVESSTTSRACQNAAPTQVNTSSVIGLGGAGVPIPDPGCANGAPNTVTGIPMLLPIVCNADDGQPVQAGNTSNNQPQGVAPYGVREALDVYTVAMGATAAAKVTTGASESLAVAPPVQTCPAGQTGTPPNCVTTPPAGCPAGQTGTPPNCVTPAQPICNANGDNDCVTGVGPTGPSIPEGAAEDTARDCAANVTGEGKQNCPGPVIPAVGKTRCNSNGDNDCVNGSGPFGPRLPENGATDRARDCAEGGANEGGPTSCPSGASAARTRSSLPFTGLDLLPLGIAGLVLLSGGGLLLRRRSGASRID
ncbi:MAG: hypothetical protein ACR2ND_10560 [Solirubrobacteraceae bacterium]